MRLLPILLWVVTCATALHCPALSYPRLLRGVLDRADVAHVSQLFFELEGEGRMRPNDRREKVPSTVHEYLTLFYPLIGHASTRQPGYTRTVRVIQRVQARLAAEFTGLADAVDLVFHHDTYLFHADGVIMNPLGHQDWAFFIVEGPCRGFNVWIHIAGGAELNATPIVYEIERNGLAYADAFRHHAVPAVPGAKGRSLRIWASHIRRIRDDLEPSQWTLGPGDALVLRAPEIHRTAMGQLRPDEWQLGLIFKVLPRARLVSPLPDFLTQPLFAAAQRREHWGCVLPPLTPGRLHPDLYNMTRVLECVVPNRGAPPIPRLTVQQSRTTNPGVALAKMRQAFQRAAASCRSGDEPL